ncbi:MAG: hypothetical protein GX621_05685 [Pirellulaceae bacterium]|nr:hypothetical protein [Pirellulaceae bacterium]
MFRFPALVLGFVAIFFTGAAQLRSDEPLVVDFAYQPPLWRTAICPPDDPHKTLVDEQGRLLYHYPGRGRWFGTHVAVKVSDEAKTVGQELVSPRVAIIRTHQEAPNLTIVQEAFALREQGPAEPPKKFTAERKDRNRMERNWAKPTGGVTPKLSTIAVGSGRPILHQIRVTPGEAITVAVGLCEGWHDRPGKRVLELQAEGAPTRRVDMIADLGKNVAGAFWFDAKDVDRDGFITLSVGSSPESDDKTPILNGFWVFDGPIDRDDDALLAGEYDERAALVHYAGDRDNLSRNDVALVRVTNHGATSQTIEPRIVVNSNREIEPFDDHVRVDGHELVTTTHPIASIEKETLKDAQQATMTLAPLTIPAGETVSFAVVYCGGGRIVRDPANMVDAQQARLDCQEFWETVELPYDRVNVPDERIQALIDSSIRNIWQAREIKNGLPAFQVGATCYRSLFIVDGAFILEAASMVGAGADTRAGIEYMLSFQQEDGRFELLPRYHKENGIVLWTCVRHAMLTQDKEWLRSIWPKLEKTVGYIKHLRKLSLEDPTPMNDGLLPAGHPDGGINWYDQYEYTNVYWNLLGLKAIARAAHWIGKDQQADEWQREFDDFHAVFRKAAERDMRHDIHGNRYLPILMTIEDRVLPRNADWYYPCKAQWAFCHGVYPGQLFDKDDPLVKGNLDMLATYEKEGMVTTTGWLTHGIWNYFASFYGHALLWQGDGRAAAKQLYAFANHASPLLAWLEEQGYRGAPISENGDMPHNWASAEFVRLAIHLLALDRGNEMHLFEGLPVEWTRPGMTTRLDGIATPFGPLSAELRVSDDGKSATLTVEPLSDAACERIVVHLGGWASADKEATTVLNPRERHQITIPLVPLPVHELRADGP